MQSANNIAIKEWAVVCAALAAGNQTILLRKGGIDEGSEGFRVEHREFWLLPTRFHQDPSALKPGTAAGLPSSVEQQGIFPVDLYGVVQEVFDVCDLTVLGRLAEQHILSNETVEKRFLYRHPGVFVLAVRIYRIPSPHNVSDTPYIAGCKSWVELPEALPTEGAAPVLDDAVFAARLQFIESSLHS